jgi:hypothetical protein
VGIFSVPLPSKNILARNILARKHEILANIFLANIFFALPKTPKRLKKGCMGGIRFFALSIEIP